MNKRNIHFILFASLFLMVSLMVGCASSMKKDFDQIKIGMSRDQVVEVLGSPSRSDYRMNKMIFTYRYFDNGEPLLKEIHFDKFKVIYIGDPLPAQRTRYASDADERAAGNLESLKKSSVDETIQKDIEDASVYKAPGKIEKEDIESKKVVPVFKDIDE